MYFHSYNNLLKIPLTIWQMMKLESEKKKIKYAFYMGIGRVKIHI